MPFFELVFFSTTSNELANFKQALKAVSSLGLRVKLKAYTKFQMEDEKGRKAFIEEALNADAVVITLMGGGSSCPAWGEFIPALAKARQSGLAPYFHLQPTGGNQEVWELALEQSDGMENGRWRELNSYFRHGGAENAAGFLLALANLLTGSNYETPPVWTPPTEGVYHPDWPGSPELKTYLKALDPGKPLIGIWFYQNLWVNNALKHIDALIRAVEKKGGQVLAVFHYRFKDSLVGNQGADQVIKNFFQIDGRTIIQALISPMMFSLGMASPAYEGLLEELGVPVIQAITTMQPREEWQKSLTGLTALDVTMSLAQPEFDGNLISAPIAAKEQTEKDPVTGALPARYIPIPDRVEQAVSLALNWAKLRRKPNPEKKVAIIFHHYPPRNDRIGCAAGLDSFASVHNLLKAMVNEGYSLEETYANGQELAEKVLQGMTTDRRFLGPKEMAKKAVGQVEPQEYKPWHEALPPKNKSQMTKDWGAMPGELYVEKGKILIPGIINGNVFISMQPPRGFLEQVDKIYHDPLLSPPHHYLAFYRFIKNIFKADIVLHIGKHGSLEWLPGKGAGLSAECYPELAIMDLPNVYPYIINDPGEGTQAKRRSSACIIDHMTPVMVNADLYEDLAQVDNLVHEYNQARIEDPAKLQTLRPMILKAIEEADLDKELGMATETDLENDITKFEHILEKLHEYLGQCADTLINDGLHTLGQAPRKDALINCLAQLTRLDNGKTPSLRRSIIEAWGYDYDRLLENAGQAVTKTGQTGQDLVQKAQETCLLLLKALAERSYDRGQVKRVVRNILGKEDSKTCRALYFALDQALPRLKAIKKEITATLMAMAGRHVAAGPSGAPSRGQVDVLPTGRNFYSVDPRKIPSPAAYKVGSALGQALLERHLEEKGRYPENIGIILWASPTMRDKGDDVAEILWLMGLMPVWQKGSGNVTGLEVIPLEKLGRPRLDVTPRISGIFRDAFPNLVELIDQGVRMAAALKEDPGSNFLRGHVLLDMAFYQKQGFKEKEAFRQATLRLFGAPPGAYGAGVAEVIEAKNWQDINDLGNVFLNWSSHAYGQGVKGQNQKATYQRLLKRMDVTLKNEDSREYDMMSCTDFYSYHGGLIAAVRSARGEAPISFAGDSSDPDRVKVRTAAEEAKHVFRSRLLNPKWIQGLMRHGYKGAGDISKAVDVAFGWDATSDVVEDYMYERLVQRTAFDPQIREWMNEVNPAALFNITEKLLEAIKRGMWKARQETEAELTQIYLEAEGEVEQSTDTQGNGENK